MGATAGFELSLLELFIGAGSVLSATIVYLFKMVIGLNKSQIAISANMGELKGRQAGITSMSESVLDTVHEAIMKKNQDILDKINTQVRGN